MPCLIQKLTIKEILHKINSLFVNRWSPRSMTGEDIDDDELMSLFEAARWAPSSYNNQPRILERTSLTA